MRARDPAARGNRRVAALLGACAIAAALPCLAGGVSVVGYTLTDNGDNDGFADTNETVQMYLTLENTSDLDLTGVVVTLAGGFPEVDCISWPRVVVGDLAAGAVVDLDEALVFTLGDVQRERIAERIELVFDVDVASDQGLPWYPATLTLDPDLDGQGGATPTTFFEGFESGTGLAGFTTVNLDFGRHNPVASDGYRCQYNDPDWVESNSYGLSSDCFLGATPAQADAFFWQLNGPGSADSGRAFSGLYSLYMGVYGPNPDENTTPLATLEAVELAQPVSLGWKPVCSISDEIACDLDADCPVGESCVEVVPTLSFKHQIQLMGELAGAQPGTSTDRAVVLVQRVDAAGQSIGVWTKVYPSLNVYDAPAADNFTNCSFDPVDDGSTEGDRFDLRLGPSSTCFPEMNFVLLGDTDGSFDPQNVGRASDGPGLQGSLGPGTWVESRFNLQRFRGSRLRVRLLTTAIKVEDFETWEHLFAHNPSPSDDGWWVDEITIRGTLVDPATVKPDKTTNDQLVSNSDADTVNDACDNCDLIVNEDQFDQEQDGVGNACDNCIGYFNPEQSDVDGDTVGDICDNCPFVPNPAQEDAEGDGIGDACAPCPDGDGDGFECTVDNCPAVSNPNQQDGDDDGIGDVCDLCALDPRNDEDQDFVCGDVDNCSTAYNPDQNAAVRLTGSFPQWANVFELGLSPDGVQFVFRADRDVDEKYELYSVPAGGGATVKLNDPPPFGGDVVEFVFSADGSRVVYLADQDVNGIWALHSVPTTGGTPAVKLTDLPATNRDIAMFAISPDSSRVVYVADMDFNDVFELYSVSALGGPIVKLNAAFDLERDVSTFRIGSDGTRVVYRADQDANDVFALYSVPTGGGATVRLDPSGTVPAAPPPVITPDGNTVIYLADPGSTGQFEVLSVPVTGGTSIRLNPELVGGAGVAAVEPRVTPDSATLVYLADLEVDGVFELYAVPVAGGASVKLNGNLTGGGDVSPDFEISSDGGWVVYLADQELDEVAELFRSPIGGGAAVKLNAAPVAGGDVVSFRIDDAAVNVVYRADQDTDDGFEVFSSPIGGGPPLRLNMTLPVGGDVVDLMLEPGGEYLVYQADQFVDGRLELFRVPVAGGVAQRISAANLELVASGFVVVGEDKIVGYRAQEILGGPLELFAAWPDPDPDGDGIIQPCDVCPQLFDPAQVDEDRDGVGALCGDCIDSDPAVAAGAPETNDGVDNQCPGDPGYGLIDETADGSGFLDVGNENAYLWPVQPGATAYEVARGDTPRLDVGCVTWVSQIAVFVDVSDPSPGSVFFYLNRALTPNAGSWGADSNGIERSGCSP